MQESPEQHMARIQKVLHNLELEGVEDRRRMREIERELTEPRTDSRSAWDRALDGNAALDFDHKESLRREFDVIQNRERSRDRAIGDGRKELDKIHGRVSAEKCQQTRPEFVRQIKRLLEGLREISKANQELQRIRNELEAQGIRTGSLPSAIFDIGPWDSPAGGLMPSYRKHLTQFYPELKKEIE